MQVRLSDDDVERERSIVVEEWRQGRGCAQRATEEFFKLEVEGRYYIPVQPWGGIVTSPLVLTVSGRSVHPGKALARRGIGSITRNCLMRALLIITV